MQHPLEIYASKEKTEEKRLINTHQLDQLHQLSKLDNYENDYFVSI